MSSLTLFNSSESKPLLALSAVFLFVISTILIGIVTMWQFLRQKISNEISARTTKISDARTTKITNDLSAHDTQIFNAELSKIYAELNNKLTAKIGKIKACDDDFTKKAQKILSMVSNITARQIPLKKLAVIILADLRPISPQSMLPSKLFRSLCCCSKNRN